MMISGHPRSALRACGGLALCLLLASGPGGAAPAVHRPPRGASPAPSVTGSYERHYRGKFSGNLEVQQLSGGRIKFQLVAEGQVLSPGGPTLSSVNGIVPLRHGAAFYQKGDGRLALRFQGRRVVVSQSGDMQFALGVVADGVYVRDGRVPYFDPAFADASDPDR